MNGIGAASKLWADVRSFYRNVGRRFEVPERAKAQGIAARSDETPQAVQPEGQEPDPEGDAPNA
jgi:hypothetical protein